MCTPMFRSIVCGGQDVETTKVSFDRGLDEEDVQICCAILLSHRKRWNTAICDNMDNPQEYYAKWNKSVRES